MRAESVKGTAVSVECTFCGVEMSGYSGVASGVRYFRCHSCRRCFSSMYAEIFSADAEVRVVSGSREEVAAEDFAAVKQRLEQWLSQIDSQDPYRVLGLSRKDSFENIKSRYRELAFERHPDRGGSAEQMKELNLAYGRLARRKSPLPSREDLPPPSRPLAKR